MNGRKWVGLTLGFIGFLPILMSQSSEEEGLHHLFFLSWAEISVMIAAACSVCGWVMLRQLVKEKGFSPLMANGGSMLMGGAMALLHSYFVEDWDPVPVSEAMPFIECSLWLIVISNFVCYNLYGNLLKRFTATFISFAGFTTPLFAALFGWYYLGEVVSMPFYISAIIVFAGLFIFNQEELKQGYAVPANG
jgi:drug/metabolite transporter (DMT)-like permease